MKKKNCIILFFLAVILFVSSFNVWAQVVVEPVDVMSKKAFDYTTSWIGNSGGTQSKHIPHTVEDLYVCPNGYSVISTSWDEGGTNVLVFSPDGEILSIPENSGTGGYGRYCQGRAVMDDDYVYILLTQNGCDGANSGINENGLPNYPACDTESTWHTVRRFNLDGTPAPFDGGYGSWADMLVVDKGDNVSLRGLAVNDKELFVYEVYVGEPDRIRVYDKLTMSLKREFPSGLELGEKRKPDTRGKMYFDNQNGLWILLDNKVARISKDDGTLLNEILFPEEANVMGFSIDLKNDRLLAANRGKDSNILIYEGIYNSEDTRMTGTFGETGGIYSKTETYVQGETGPLRFTGPVGVGVDEEGHIHIANTFLTEGNNQGMELGAASTVEIYDEVTKERLSIKEGLIFTATADFDPENLSMVYSPSKLHKINLSDEKLGGRVDRCVAYTADLFKYPDDPRNERKYQSFITCAWIRIIDGQKFLFVSDMYSGMVAGYRFNMETDGYIGIPCMHVDGTTFWVDKNGDGAKQENELSKITTEKENFVYPDKLGNIWKTRGRNGFSLYMCNGVKNGILQYRVREMSLSLPGDMDEVRRIVYDDKEDALYLSGFSPETTGERSWTAGGSIIVKFKNVLKRFKEGDADIKNWTPDLFLKLHYSSVSGSDKRNMKGFTVEGDYIFTSLYQDGIIGIYDNETGIYQGYIEPGENVTEDNQVQRSGWTDFDYPINVRRHSNGRSYFIANEENWCSKVMLYTWKYDPELDDVYQVNIDDNMCVYPVPAADRLNIKLEKECLATVILYSLDGKIVLQKEIMGLESLDVSQLRAGTYILQVLAENKTFRRAIIVQ